MRAEPEPEETLSPRDELLELLYSLPARNSDRAGESAVCTGECWCGTWCAPSSGEYACGDDECECGWW